MKKFLSILSLSACAVLAVSSSAISVSAMPPRNGGSSTRGAVYDSKVIGDAVSLRIADDAGDIKLSHEERTSLNDIVHNNELIGRDGHINPFGGPADKSDLARECVNKIAQDHNTTVEQLKEDRSKSFI